MIPHRLWYVSLGLLAMAVATFSPRSGAATVVAHVPLAALVDASSHVFHGMVVRVDPRAGERGGAAGGFVTEVDFEVEAWVKGNSRRRTHSVRLFGGQHGEQRVAVPGMPRFAVGDEVVVLLESTAEGGSVVSGLGLGVFWVERPQALDGTLDPVRDQAAAAVRVRRQLDGMTLMPPPPGMLPRAWLSVPDVVPETLPALLRELRRLAGDDR